MEPFERILMQGKTRILDMTVDITNEKQITAELQASEARARAIIDASPVPLALAYESGTVTYLNPRSSRPSAIRWKIFPPWSDWRLKAFPDPTIANRS
jgi:PAS domain-containing protein